MGNRKSEILGTLEHWNPGTLKYIAIVLNPWREKGMRLDRISKTGEFFAYFPEFTGFFHILCCT